HLGLLLSVSRRQGSPLEDCQLGAEKGQLSQHWRTMVALDSTLATRGSIKVIVPAPTHGSNLDRGSKRRTFKGAGGVPAVSDSQRDSARSVPAPVRRGTPTLTLTRSVPTVGSSTVTGDGVGPGGGGLSFGRLPSPRGPRATAPKDLASEALRASASSRKMAFRMISQGEASSSFMSDCSAFPAGGTPPTSPPSSQKSAATRAPPLASQSPPSQPGFSPPETADETAGSRITAALAKNTVRGGVGAGASGAGAGMGYHQPERVPSFPWAGMGDVAEEGSIGVGTAGGDGVVGRRGSISSSISSSGTSGMSIIGMGWIQQASPPHPTVSWGDLRDITEASSALAPEPPQQGSYAPEPQGHARCATEPFGGDSEHRRGQRGDLRAVVSLEEGGHKYLDTRWEGSLGSRLERLGNAV
ncbi:unnamed protein product, partial [Discosporangium mesarthrocarpum]